MKWRRKCQAIPVYSSLLRGLGDENENQITSFLAAHPEFSSIDHKALWQETLDMPFYPFQSEKYLNLTPLNTKTDGFFFCALKKDK